MNKKKININNSKNVSSVGLSLIVGGVVLYLLLKNKKTEPFPKQIIVGDVNGDGIVDNSDWNAAQNIMLFRDDPITGKPYTSDQLMRADVNGDGEVDIGDLLAIENIILTQINS